MTSMTPSKDLKLLFLVGISGICSTYKSYIDMRYLRVTDILGSANDDETCYLLGGA